MTVAFKSADQWKPARPLCRGLGSSDHGHRWVVGIDYQDDQMVLLQSLRNLSDA